MKYGMRERVSGAVILIALAVIAIPMLFDDTAPRGERPEPTMTLERPVDVERRDVPDPQPPASLGEVALPSEAASPESASPESASDAPEVSNTEAETASAAAERTADEGDETSSSAAEAPREDPIADLARAADERLSRQAETSAGEGEWAVQVGSFGEPDNAQRLAAQLTSQGLPVYRRDRDSGLTTVYVGPYATSREAEAVMAELKADANLQGLLVKADN